MNFSQDNYYTDFVLNKFNKNILFYSMTRSISFEPNLRYWKRRLLLPFLLLYYEGETVADFLADILQEIGLLFEFIIYVICQFDFLQHG